MNLKHFLLSEFDSPDAAGSGSKMQPEFLSKLDAARGIANIPFRVNSGFRTIAHNKAVGGETNSSHTKGWAADLSYKSGSEGYRILKALLDAGFTRIGVYKTWIHADCDPDLPAQVIWSK